MICSQLLGPFASICILRLSGEKTAVLPFPVQPHSSFFTLNFLLQDDRLSQLWLTLVYRRGDISSSSTFSAHLVTPPPSRLSVAQPVRSYLFIPVLPLFVPLHSMGSETSTPPLDDRTFRHFLHDVHYAYLLSTSRSSINPAYYGP